MGGDGRSRTARRSAGRAQTVDCCMPVELCECGNWWDVPAGARWTGFEFGASVKPTRWRLTYPRGNRGLGFYWLGYGKHILCLRPITSPQGAPCRTLILACNKYPNSRKHSAHRPENVALTAHVEKYPGRFFCCPTNRLGGYRTAVRPERHPGGGRPRAMSRAISPVPSLCMCGPCAQ